MAKFLAVSAALGMASARKVSLLATRERPIAKVVKMLTDMKTQLEAEAEDDQAVYEKLTCWCETNKKEKTAERDHAASEITRLENAIGEDYATMKKLEEDVSNLNREIQKNKSALYTANNLDMKETKEFSTEEKQTVITISALKGAITALSNQHPSLGQMKSVARILKREVVKPTEDHSTIEGMVALKGFLDNVEKANSFLQIEQPAGYQSAAPQSGQIYGILKQMLDTNQANLKTIKGEEGQRVQAHKDLVAAKKAEIAAGEKLLGEKRTQLANVTSKHAQAKQDLEENEETLDNANAFLADLNEKCSQTDADYARRTKSRAEEIAAVADTIKILNDDAAFDNFDKTVNSGFLQTRMLTHNEKRDQIVKLLEKSTNPKIMLIATYAKLDAFTKVKEAIAGLISELQAQQKDEVDHRDFCIKEFNENDQESISRTRDRTDAESKIADLTSQIETLTTEIAELTAANAEANKQMERASDNRAAENADFNQIVADQRITQQILNKAMGRMMQKYGAFFQMEQQPGAAHTQTSATSTDAGNGPARFAGHGDAHNAGGKKVVALLKSVITDSQKAVDDAATSENDSRVAYEGFMKQNNKSIEANNKSITTKTANKAQAQQDKAVETGNKEAAETALKSAAHYKHELHGSCDFVMDNFDARQRARSEEMEALRQATAILSGSK